MTEISFTVDELTVPTAPGAAGWNDFVAMVAVRNTVDAEAYGSDELDFTPEELLPVWQNQRYEPKRALAARVEGRIVARATFERLPVRDADSGETTITTSAEANAAPRDVAWLSVQVLPEWRRHGIGRALTDRIEALAAADGCRTLIVYAASRPAPGATLASPTGFGAVPLGNAEVRFLLRRGYRLEQVERGSRLSLPIGPDLLASFAEQAAEFAGVDFIVHCWCNTTPPEWRENIAMLYSRMSSDAPSAGLKEPVEVWTAERIVDEEQSFAGSPRVLLTAAVRHIPTGRLVGYSQLSVPAELTRPVSQEDTLVLREYRGHRLGMLLKVANLHYLQGVSPGHPSIITFNAEENRHMLAVNEALGFVPIGYEGAWRRSLPAPPAPLNAAPEPAASNSDRD
ncbi:GNAT family N-acetyltransferase [Cryobacterium melibiosiphilum]|uniref:GNAT family N-acetyltransferase n=1 Tax=Cryobacterium melibiosiphilum TaxID=995039 RepID=A0A3A5MH30_9MICO|nr:GNAT family N-acetyltransferase [Cryobacterium melibiosiphilum]RJT84701.1 GNAT family N-acetyltransferase [Cryobacterium melibiosiphilum]